MALSVPAIMEGLGSMWCDLFYKTFHSVFENKTKQKKHQNTLHLFISMCSTWRRKLIMQRLARISVISVPLRIT